MIHVRMSYNTTIKRNIHLFLVVQLGVPTSIKQKLNQ